MSGSIEAFTSTFFSPLVTEQSPSLDKPIRPHTRRNVKEILDLDRRLCYTYSMQNPVAIARRQRDLTLREFADEIKCNWMMLYLTEQGCYWNVPTSIMDDLDFAEITRPMVEAQYHSYQHEKRIANGALFDLTALKDLGPPSDRPPVGVLRSYIGIANGHPHGLSRMGFAKTFCLHSGELYDLEKGRKYTLSEQFKTAMRQAGLSDNLLSELEFRQGEFARGEWG